MESEYDAKFEEMKQYIPFLESMIKRLENTNATENPRQAQLDKIRSLRDLLLEKKKRMKMENLLKCEQVLVNLYAKVEQRDTLPGIKKASEIIVKNPDLNKQDLEKVRNKLKTVTGTIKTDPDTLPEIARANESEAACTPGSKEPALFQRRPNKSPVVFEKHSPSPQTSRRNYSRTLVSPEKASWDLSHNPNSDKPLFVRRSPLRWSRRSPRRSSPSYHKKERKKSLKRELSNRKPKDLNITLNVPEESLNSLNTKDILSRIINCSDDDVDIKTLRELRTQILGELKYTGTNNDISDLILKSYQSKKTTSKTKDKDEIEEGELSDSESEAIDSIYGSLVVVEKDRKESKSNQSPLSEQVKPRKVQICLVLNSENAKVSDAEIPGNNEPNKVDKEDFEMLSLHDVKNVEMECENKSTYDKNIDPDLSDQSSIKQNIISMKSKSQTENSENLDTNRYDDLLENTNKRNNSEETSNHIKETKEIDQIQEKVFKPNFYKPISEPDNNTTVETVSNSTTDNTNVKLDQPEHCADQAFNMFHKSSENTEIPLLNGTSEEKETSSNKTELVSEIDILQALKKEILSEHISIPGAETETPLLHQPKITKVASAQEIKPKKRISIESYKEKVVSSKTSQYVADLTFDSSNEDNLKKQSLKLTEKECERFNFPVKLALDYSSDEDDKKKSTVDIYADLAPKSPEASTEQFSTVNPVIIPVEPVKNIPITSITDTDMRKLLPLLSPSISNSSPFSTDSGDNAKIEIKPDQNKYFKPLIDPRVNRDVKQPLLPTPNSHSNPSRTPIRSTPNPNYSANNPSMTPNMAPSFQCFEVEDSSSKHVYAPILSSYDHREQRDTSVVRDMRHNRWEMEEANKESNNFRYNNEKDQYYKKREDDNLSRDNLSPYYENYQQRNTPLDQREGYSRLDMPLTPSHPFGRLEGSSTPNHIYGRNDCSSTPSHPFGRNDCPSTPTHAFGQNECHTPHLTPVHSFGRGDCPGTPVHPFGRADVPTTPLPSFGRSEMPHTPVHHFGRSDYSSNQMNSRVGKDPRLNRSNDYDSYNRRYEREDRYVKSHHSNYNENKWDAMKNNNYRNFARETGGRNDRSYPQDQGGSYCNRDRKGDSRYAPERDFKNNKSHDRDGVSAKYEYKKSDFETGHRENHQNMRAVQSRSYRSSSVGRNHNETSSDKTLSVKPYVGRSFTIDASVNKTFQEFIDRHGLPESPFEIRKQRAASVGRSIVREPSVGRTLSTTHKSISNEHYISNKHRYRRASSVGRDVMSSRSKESFRDIKAEFQLFKSNYDLNQEKKNNNSLKKEVPTNPVKNSANEILRSRKSTYEIEKKHNTLNHTTYSAKKNVRDPRMRREQYQMKQRDEKNRKHSHENKTYGIVYSNDNIAKGTILGAGSGVKNYKIPKIKRPVEEEDKTKETEVKSDLKKNEKIEDKSSEIKKHSMTSKNIEGTKSRSSDKKKKVTNSSTKVDVEKRVTRSNKSFDTKTEDDDEIKVTKRAKKYMIPDSDSDDDSATNKSVKNDETINVPKTEIDITKKLESGGVPKNAKSNEILSNIPIESLNLEKKVKNKVVESLESSFSLDDLEIFSDNVGSDPVIDNINALIADLDNEIDDTKDEDKNETIRKKSPIKDIIKVCTEKPIQMSENITLNEIDEQIDLPKSCNSIKEGDSFFSCDSNFQNKKQPETLDVINSAGNNKGSLITTDEIAIISVASPKKDDIVEKITNEEIVSTSDSVVETAQSIESPKGDNLNTTPDSTINSDETVVDGSIQEGLPDSTAENETNVTTSTGTSKDILNPNSSQKELLVESDPFGSLLSILQDKSKIKELLSMLGDKTSENDKIKKKLEKLSEIVFDDDDDQSQQKLSCDENNKVDNNEESILNNKDTVSKDKKINDGLRLLNNEDSILCKDGEEGMAENLLIDSRPREREDHLSTQKINILSDNSEKHDYLLATKTIQMNTIVTETRNEEKKRTVTDVQSEVEKEVSEMHENYSQAAGEESLKDIQTQEPVQKARAIKRMGKRETKFKKSVKRITRQTLVKVADVYPDKPKIKRQNRELKSLQNDIREMFISDDILNVSSIRQCRLAKLSDEKNLRDLTASDSESSGIKKTVEEESPGSDKSIRKKPGPKTKSKNSNEIISTAKEADKNQTQCIVKCKPGPKSKTKLSRLNDPYAFETDSNIDVNSVNHDEKISNNSSDSDSDSSSTKSIESTDLKELKKKKKKRKPRGWQSGIIKPKHKKKTMKAKIDSTETSLDLLSEMTVSIPDVKCFTDKTYCFKKNVFNYSCRMCTYTGNDIVHHFKKRHPHSEIPLSRMSPEIAKEAIAQCEEVNFAAISKLPTEKYVCRFCFKEFSKKKPTLESFFWHIVSMHTGEYKQLCGECINVQRCPFNLDIPPPPKSAQGQLIGYICGKCNFTQISLENLKTHVIDRHNDEQTEVYTINLSMMSRKTINTLLKRLTSNKSRVLRSSRSNVSMTETSDDHSEASDNVQINKTFSGKRSYDMEEENTKSNIKSQITFENDDNSSGHSTPDILHSVDSFGSKVKIERQDSKEQDEICQASALSEPTVSKSSEIPIETEHTIKSSMHSMISDKSDVIKYPHFKILNTESGTREYVCCINGQDSHYKTTMTISMKKHIQIVHKEKWDGYCFVCQLIVTPQGKHSFTECFQHFFDKHIDNFEVSQGKAPVARRETENLDLSSKDDQIPVSSPTKSYLSVRPMSELINNLADPQNSDDSAIISLPKIQSVVSLGSPNVELPRTVPTYPVAMEKKRTLNQYKYEEWQARVMSLKHRVVLETMMARNKLCHVFKCSGRYCSFSTDSAEDSLLHASTHQRVGGEGALNCVYCDFDASGNAIDLVMHVFKIHCGCQYFCGYCFYRSAASQLVDIHHTKAHPDLTPMILRTTVVVKPPGKDDSEDMLSRTEAVPHYVCGNISADTNPCSFRTYTSTKFNEHLQQRHADDTQYLCYICSTSFCISTELVNHMKDHGLRLYQCPWCVHGEDNEDDFLNHSSSKHPDKPPQTYLRIITGKDGTFRVLPLAYLNKSNVLTEDVTPGSNSENSVKEAERSIELENLIGHTMLLIKASEKESVNTASDDINPEPGILGNITEVSRQATPVLEILNPTITQPESSATTTHVSQQSTLVVKKEIVTPEKVNANANVIYSLDSDDEDVGQCSNIIDLSNDDNMASGNLESPKTDKNLEPNEWKQCNKCHMYFNDINILQEHVILCYPYLKRVTSCPVCQLQLKSDSVLQHVKVCIPKKLSVYKKDLMIMPKTYICSVCKSFSASVADVRGHMKKVHFITKTAVETKCVKPNGATEYIVQETTKPQAKPKRKLSSSSVSKQKRYGPQDINQLPINPILDDLVYCALCEFHTKVRLNMVRHLLLHAEQQPVPQTAPVNPVPHLETNEKHFDKMINLASSSLVTRADKSRTESSLTVLQMTPENATRYPKFVPERQRHTCGAKGCSYISVDEAMLKYHWEALHTNSNDYHCVHCPPFQLLDKAKSLTAIRVITHLRMHDSNLYACSTCPYYHYKQQTVEKHIHEAHKGSSNVMVVREESNASSAQNVPSVAAPTMDLKAWHCGLCEFKSMIRPEVVEHCGKIHQSKMQFKCVYCPFRTSTEENVTKHQASSHIDKTPDVFYYYYREGDLQEETNGVPLWVSQQKTAPKITLEVKPNIDTSLLAMISKNIQPSPEINLGVVKTEVLDPETKDGMEELCRKFGQFCDPNGLKYKCPLCKIVIEDYREAMQSHLYEELRYRKWACKVCNYKAFHKKGLDEHMSAEHGMKANPIELPVDVNVETWVAQLLDHQETIITQSRDSLMKNRVQDPQPAKVRQVKPVAVQEKPKTNVEQAITGDEANAKLEDAFGNFGVPSDMSFCCPKCEFKSTNESIIQDHLETELNKIRWSCSHCVMKFQNYHEVQFHCKNVHPGKGAGPVGVARDLAMRNAWVAAVIKSQKSSMTPESVASEKDTVKEQIDPTTSKASESLDTENSLLVVRYEEKISAPEGAVVRRKRPAEDDSDEDRLVIDETSDDSTVPKKKPKSFECQYCSYSSRFKQTLRNHLLRHYNLKLISCGYCDYKSDNQKKAFRHLEVEHPGLKPVLKRNSVPDYPPEDYKPPSVTLDTANVDNNVVCLSCTTFLSETDSASHKCGATQRLSTVGNIVVECGICSKFFANVNTLNEHHKAAHKDVLMKHYTFFKIISKKGAPVFEKLTYMPTIESSKRSAANDTILPPQKRVARKSTSKLPSGNSVAKKSTTKLPLYVYSDSEVDSDDDYSYYGTKPLPIDFYKNISTMMPFYNSVMKFNVKQISELIQIEPRVLVIDIKK